MKLAIIPFLSVLLLLFSCNRTVNEPVLPFNVSGSVLDNDGLGVEAVKMHFGADDFTLTDSIGHWVISGLVGGHTITPKKENYTFDPPQIIIDSTESNILFIATDTTIAPPLEYEVRVYNWFKNLQLPNGLLESSENSNIISLYDNALAALVFISYGDFERAEKIFDFFKARIDTELLPENGGFSQFRNRNGNPNNHRWMGDNAWLLIALNNYVSVTGSTEYHRLSEEIENWLRSLQDSDGGLWGGFNSDNTQIHKITEGNIDAFNAVLNYDTFHVKLLNYLKNERWDTVEQLLISWPGTQQYLFALDLHPWGYCIFEDFPVAVLAKASRYITTKTSTVLNKQITGYCFDIDKDVVWLEGTGEMIVAFQHAGQNTEAEYYTAELEKMILESAMFSNSAGLPYTTNFGTHYGDSELWKGADINPAISSGAWYLFAKNKFNPFSTGRTKNIPEADKFWKN